MLIGAAALITGKSSTLSLPSDEAELACWIGPAYRWNEYAVQACIRLATYGFEELGLDRIWCIVHEDDSHARRTAEKSGFTFDHMLENVRGLNAGKAMAEEVYSLDRLMLDDSDHGMSPETKEKVDMAWNIADVVWLLSDGIIL